MPHFDLGEDGGVAESVDVPGESLGSQLASAKAWLSARNDEGAISKSGVRLFCSWMPTQGKRAMTLPATLVQALADAHGTFWLDVYPSEDEDRSIG